MSLKQKILRGRRKFVVTAIAGTLGIAALGIAGVARADGSLADTLHTIPTNVSQLVIVHSPQPTSSWATLETFSKVNGTWQVAFPKMVARVGAKGFSDNHVEGTPTTPTGVYSFLPTMYGVGINPNVKYGYHQLVQDDYWNENSGSPGYNSFQHGSNPGGPSEALWQIYPQYSHLAVLNYNMPAIPGKGSGIFLHEGVGNPTAGCVSLSNNDLLDVLTWLDPAASPRIVLSADEDLSRY